MSEGERHDLLFFWTSSPVLPATERGLVPRPSVVVRPQSDGDRGMLPTANTCISRLSVPAYPSRQVLRVRPSPPLPAPVRWQCLIAQHRRTSCASPSPRARLDLCDVAAHLAPVTTLMPTPPAAYRRGMAAS